MDFIVDKMREVLLMEKKLIRIGLMGFGNIGTGTYAALEMNRSTIEQQTGIDFHITKIL